MVQLSFGPKGTSLAASVSVGFEDSLLQVEDAIPASLVQTMRNAVKSAGFGGKSVVISPPPNKVDVRTLTLPGSERDLDKMLRWEAESYLHYDVDDASIDHVRLGGVKVGNEERSEVLVAAIGKPYIHALLDVFSKAGLAVKAADIVPMALSRLASYVGRDVDAPVSVVDIGRASSVAVILNEGNLRLTRTISKGSEELTARIMGSLEVDHDEAELLKKEYGAGAPGHGAYFASEQELVTKTEVAGTVHEILRYDLEEMAEELQKLFRYFSNQCKGVAISRGYLCGGGGKLKGLDAFLSDRTGVHIERLPPLNTVFGGESDAQEPGSEDRAGPEYAAAAGLALRDAHGERD